MTGIEKLRNLSATLGEGQPFTLEGIYIGGKTASEWLADVADQIERETLPRPLFEDGTPVQFGDEVRHSDQGHVFKVDCIEVYKDGWSAVSQRNGVRDVARPGEAFKRLEPPDTWERLECDVDTGRGFYDMDKAEAMEEVLRRCKALAGVE